MGFAVGALDLDKSKSNNGGRYLLLLCAFFVILMKQRSKETGIESSIDGPLLMPVIGSVFYTAKDCLRCPRNGEVQL